MKLLLAAAGIKNASIQDALVGLLGKPIAECEALCIPTAGYGHPIVSPVSSWCFVSGQEPQCPMTELGWKSVGLLELTALASIGPDRWDPWVEQTDVLLVNGGDPIYLYYWMRESGLAELLVARRHSMGGVECGEHGDDTPYWRRLRHRAQALLHG